MMTRILLPVIFLLLALFIAACSGANSSPATPLAMQPTSNPERDLIIMRDTGLQNGQYHYNLRCAHCHGYNGEGQLASTVQNTLDMGMILVPAQDATGHTWEHPDQLLREVILRGIPNPLAQYPMPGYEGAMTDQDIADTLDYIRLWWTDEQRAHNERVTARRAELDEQLGLTD